GALPFQADNTQDLMIRRLTDQPLRLAAARPDLAFPHELQAVLDRALQRKAADRHPTAAAFAEDLARAIRGDPRAGARTAAGAGVTAPAPLPEPETLPPTRIAPPPSARAAPGAAAPVATTGARPRTGLYRAAAGAAAVVVVLLVVLLYTRAGDVDDAVPGGGDADTPAQTAAATGVEDPPGGATETPDPPPGDATAQDPPPSPPPAGGGGARESADAAGAGTNTQPVTPGPDPTLAVRQDSLLLWRQFERLDALDLPESTLTAIVDSARTVYGRSA